VLRAIAKRQINFTVSDPELRRKVTPSDEVGCKRIMLTDDWYPTLAEANVDLIAERIDRVTPTGIRDANGVERPADAIVLATGFASHDFVAPMEIAGRGGRALADKWGDLPRAYLGLTVPEFPKHVPALRAEHERRHRLGGQHAGVRDRAPARRPA
ncbi:MAG TPA: hypothetical protein VH703_04095, partial [Solirubrobacterales bacterium]